MRRKLTLIIVDDEQAAIERMLAMLSKFVDLVVKATFTNPKEALAYLSKNHVDFVLVDMEMPVVDGMAFILQVPKAIKVIISTGHSEYATDGFDLGVVDFLLKPVSIDRLAKAIDRMKIRLKEPVGKGAEPDDNYYYFMLKRHSKHVRTRVCFDELVYISTHEGGSSFFLVEGLVAEVDRREALRKLGKRDDGAGAYRGVSAKEKLYELKEILAGTAFMQIHQSHILNTSFFREYGRKAVTLKGFEGITLPTGTRATYPEFFNYIDNHNLPKK